MHSQKSWNEITEFFWSFYAIMLQSEKGRKTMVMVGDSKFTCRTTTCYFYPLVCPIYAGAGQERLTDCLTVYSYYILGNRTHFCQYCICLILEWKVWETSHPWKKRHIETTEHYYRDNVWLKFLLSIINLIGGTKETPQRLTGRNRTKLYRWNCDS